MAAIHSSIRRRRPPLTPSPTREDRDSCAMRAGMTSLPTRVTWRSARPKGVAHRWAHTWPMQTPTCLSTRAGACAACRAAEQDFCHVTVLLCPTRAVRHALLCPTALTWGPHPQAATLDSALAGLAPDSRAAAAAAAAWLREERRGDGGAAPLRRRDRCGRRGGPRRRRVPQSKPGDHATRITWQPAPPGAAGRRWLPGIESPLAPQHVFDPYYFKLTQ